MQDVRRWTFRTGSIAVLVAAVLSIWAGTGVAAKSSTATITLSPTSGPPGTSVLVTGTGFGSKETVDILFHQSPHPGVKFLGSATTDSTGHFSKTVSIPTNASTGASTIRAQGATSRLTARATFTVT